MLGNDKVFEGINGLVWIRVSVVRWEEPRAMLLDERPHFGNVPYIYVEERVVLSAKSWHVL